jgi:hypothetical protein
MTTRPIASAGGGRTIASAASIFFTFGFLSTFAQAAEVIVLGDSLGVGISMASGAPRLARNSVAIRSADAVSQIRRTPKGSVAVLSLGTNDAVGSIAGVEAGIDQIVAAAQSSGTQLVWVGPPCVLKAWNSNVNRLDGILRTRLSGKSGVTYVSVSDQELCSRDLKARDGVHFNMRGYQLLWARAAQAGGLPIQTVKASSRPAKPAKRSQTRNTPRPAQDE